MTKNKQISLKGNADIALQKAGHLLSITDKILTHRSKSLVASDTWLDGLVAWADENVIPDAVLELLRGKRGTLNTELDHELMMVTGITVSAYTIERVARDYIAYNKVMLEIIGEEFQPYFRCWYEGWRYNPDLNTHGMTPYAEIDAAELAELFDGSSKLPTASSFDEDTYKKALPYFKKVLEGFVVAGNSVSFFLKFIIKNFGSDIKQYLKRFHQDVKAGIVIVKGVNPQKAGTNAHEEMCERRTGEGGGRSELESEQPGNEEKGESMEEGIEST